MIKREGFLNIRGENSKKKGEKNDGSKWVACKNKHITAIFPYLFYIFRAEPHMGWLGNNFAIYFLSFENPHYKGCLHFLSMHNTFPNIDCLRKHFSSKFFRYLFSFSTWKKRG